MSDERALPEQASLRYLKLAAKRRRASGEFPTLHDAQLAVAREYGQRSWSALREAVSATAGKEGHALVQLRWLAGRFAGAADPSWNAPDEQELRGHFTEDFLAQFQPGQLTARICELTPVMRDDLVVTVDTPFAAQGQLSGHLIMAMTETRPPYRLRGIQERPLGERISDPRTAGRPVATAGPVPDRMTELAADMAGRLGVVGLALAGVSLPGDAWACATGWASLEPADALRADHAFPACQVTMAVTATAVLCLAAAGNLRLDDRANAHLGEIRLADDAVTIRELLTHTGGVTDPASLTGPAVPALESVTGPVIACDGKRGSLGYSHAGFAALGEIIAARTGLAYPEAVARLVLRPLGLRHSRFPARWPVRRVLEQPVLEQPVLEQPAPDRPAAGYPAATGYAVAADGTFTPAVGEVSVFAAAGGLWTTAADLVRFGLGWRSLLPRAMAAQALRPHATQPNGALVGLGWAVNEPTGVFGIAGEAPGGSASLLVSADGRHASAAMTNRPIYLEGASAAILNLLGGITLPAGRERLH